MTSGFVVRPEAEADIDEAYAWYEGRSLVDGFPYALFFIWDEAADATSVIACMHARRDPRRWLQRA